MAEAAKEEDPLEQFWDDRKGIELIRKVFNVSDEIATDLWRRFIGTVRRMRSVAHGTE